MISFGGGEIACGHDLCRYLRFPPLILRLLCHTLGHLLLLWAVVENGAAVLDSLVIALLIFRRRVVHAVEEL